MSKITLTDLVNLENQTTAVNAINANNAILETASDNTISRDGTSPNQMLANLDMNSHRVLNLPEPITADEPVRVIDLGTLSGGGTIVVYDTEDILPETYGAVGDGVADDAPAIRLAMAAANAVGGGRVRLGPHTYRLASFSGSSGTLLPMKSNVSVIGSGPSSILKVGNGLNTAIFQFHVFNIDSVIPTQFNNMQFHDFKIDFNGANNSGWNTQNVGIGCEYGNNIVVNNVIFENSPGSQCIAFGNNSGLNITSLRITNNRFLDNGHIINSACTDHSSIYFVATDVVCANNILRMSVQDIAGTAIEVHGIDVSVTGNVIDNYNKSFNVAAQLGHTCSNVTIAGNTSMFVNYGVSGFALDGKFLTNVNVVGNTFRRLVEPVGSGVGFIDFGVDIWNTSTSNNIRIADNIISTDGTAGTAGTNPTIVFGRGTYVIEGNTIVGAIGPGIGTNGNTIAAATSVIIKDNLIQDCGRSSTPAARRGILINAAGTVDTVVISDNRIENVASAYMTTAVEISTNTTYGSLLNNNIISNVATPFSVTGTGYSALGTNIIPLSQGIGVPFSGINPVANSVLSGDGSGNPGMRTTLPNMNIGTPTGGTLTNASGLPIVAGTTGTLTRARGGTEVTTGAVVTVKQQKFTASGTYTPSTGMLYCILECFGGGGAGGGAATGATVANAGGGGGSGGYSRLTTTAAAIGASKAVTIGAGGTPGAAGANNGGNGGDTSVGSLCIGKGGTGGTFGQFAGGGGGGAGGVAGTGDNTFVGTPGVIAFCCPLATGNGFSGSGGSFWGGAGAAVAGAGTGTQSAGTAASANSGAGGSGGISGNGTTVAGGAGGAGYIRITEFCNQ